MYRVSIAALKFVKDLKERQLKEIDHVEPNKTSNAERKRMLRSHIADLNRGITKLTEEEDHAEKK